MGGNQILKTRMAESGFTQAELAEAVNADLRAAGYEGTVSDRTVRNWLTGKTRWPHHRQRAALEALFNCPVTELGFTTQEDLTPAASPRGEVHRPVSDTARKIRPTVAVPSLGPPTTVTRTRTSGRTGTAST
ncbi:helix-turn-helix transcriptional regulator [Promicromonospora sp. NPDC023805]|uniref:helix-turn-helix transcriptional regulator n=1 Tax=Promicromonospora sp. NPDC023805 TaxID=3154696 RepID=UPI0033F429BE